MALYGVGLDFNIKRIQLELKLEISRKSGKNIQELQRIFLANDKNGYGKLDIKEFEQGLAAFGFFPKKVDLQALLKYYDLDKDGQISYSEFLQAMRDPLSERRQKIVEKAYRKLDPSNLGAVDVKTFSNKTLLLLTDLLKNSHSVENFDTSKDTQVLLKRKTREQTLDEVLANIPSAYSGKITHDGFISYYTDVSVSVPSDEGFSALLENTWNIKEDEESTISKEEIKSIIKTLRFKLIQLSKGSQDEFLLRKLFKDFDLNKSGYLTLDELQAMLVRIETPVHEAHLSAVFNHIDKNKSGLIEFEEFVNFIVYDPFP